MALAPRLLSVAAIGALALGSRAARAADPFEIQVYDGTANAQGEAGLELHANYVAKGLTATEPPLLPSDKVAHFTLEPSYGVLPFWEIGGYFQTALRSDGTFDYAGVKLRSKFVTPPSWNEAHGPWRFGVNFEVSILPQGYDPDRWGSEIRPIVAWEVEHWELVVNPIVDIPLAGDGFRHGPDFEPAGMALYKTERLSFGFEYYTSLGYWSAGFSPVNDQEHYLYEVVNLLGVERLELNVGVGEGLTGGSNKIVAKTIVGYAF